MNVSVDKIFERDTDKIRDRTIRLKIAGCIEQVIQAKTISEIKNLKKMKGYSRHFRIRIGDFRAGVEIEGNNVLFVRLLHRKEIYRYFP